MKVTVIMPVFNGARYLAEAIESVLVQTYTHFEFLIINDGSTDNTEAIIKSFKDNRIKYHYHTNMGVAKSLNRGIELAKGELIWRHDADDKCLSDQLERQVEFLKKHQKFDLVSCQIAFMTDRGKIAYQIKQPKDNYFEKKPFKEVKFNQFNPYSPITHATVLMKIDVLKQLGGYRAEFLTSEDTDLWLRWIENHKAAVLNYCSYFVRLNKTSATKKYNSTTGFYRNLAFEFYHQRKKTDSDCLTRREPMPEPPVYSTDNKPKTLKGKYSRNDLLGFHYKVMLNARDWKNVFECVYLAVKDGWRLRQTWKGILFPILGDKLVQNGVNIKKAFRRH